MKNEPYYGLTPAISSNLNTFLGPPYFHIYHLCHQVDKVCFLHFVIMKRLLRIILLEICLLRILFGAETVNRAYLAPDPEQITINQLLYQSDLVAIGTLYNPAEVQNVYRINQVRIEHIYACAWRRLDFDRHFEISNHNTNVYVVTKMRESIAFDKHMIYDTMLFGDGRYLLFLRRVTNSPSVLTIKPSVDPLIEIARTNLSALPRRFAPANLPPLFYLNTNATYELVHRMAGAWCLNREHIKAGRYKYDLYPNQDIKMNACFGTSSLGVLTNSLPEITKAIASFTPKDSVERLRYSDNIIVQQAANELLSANIRQHFQYVNTPP